MAVYLRFAKAYLFWVRPQAIRDRMPDQPAWKDLYFFISMRTNVERSPVESLFQFNDRLAIVIISGLYDKQ